MTGRPLGRALALCVLCASSVAAAGPAGPPGAPEEDRSLTLPYLFGFAASVPVTYHFHLFDPAVGSRSGTYSLQFPILTVGVDRRRPSVDKASLSLSFVQVPLAAFVVAQAMGTDAPALSYLAASLLWLSGGTFHITPGGAGNLSRSERWASSLSIAVKSDLGIHPFVRPVYVRETVGLGLSFHLDKLYGRHAVGAFTCGVGVLGSVAAEYHGKRTFDPGVWAACSFLGLNLR